MELTTPMKKIVFDTKLHVDLSSLVSRGFSNYTKFSTKFSTISLRISAAPLDLDSSVCTHICSNVLVY